MSDPDRMSTTTDSDLGDYRPPKPLDERGPVLLGQVADALHQFTGGGFADLRDQGITLLAVSGVHPHLDQLVMLKREFEFVGHSFAVTGAADDNDRLERMGQFTKMTLLGFG